MELVLACHQLLIQLLVALFHLRHQALQVTNNFGQGLGLLLKGLEGRLTLVGT